jgi:parallel beta-helix repeat protein
MAPREIWLVILLALLAAPPLALLSSTSVDAARGKTFVVNSASGGFDLAGCEPVPDGCTLIDAIFAANFRPGKDAIKFNIPAAGLQTIAPTTLMPAITDPVTIDGYSQPGAKPNSLKRGTNAILLIELDGRDSGNNSIGLDIQAGPTVIRGLVINRFDRAHVRIAAGVDNTGNVVAGNFLGTNPAGSAAASPQPGTGLGVLVQSGGNRIGGADRADRNLISGNENDGVLLDDGAAKNLVEGNLIGSDAAGTGGVANVDSGVSVPSGQDNVIRNNVIAFNGAAGVDIVTGTGNRISHNSIFDNVELGIDLEVDGRTDNDVGDPPDTDLGANLLQNTPELSVATRSNQGTTVKGTLRSAPRTEFSLEFITNELAEDEGRAFLGKKTIRTDGDGVIDFTFKTKKKVGDKVAITATATDPSGITSEFSDPLAVT